jgi:type IV fimbrial biogenesis protein FimT
MNTKRPFRRQDRKSVFSDCSGLSLIELMIALAILAIILSIAAPAMSSYRDRHQFSGAALDVLGSLRRVRAVAVESNRNIVFRVDAAAGTYQAFVDDGGGTEDNAANNEWDDGERLIVSGLLPQGVDFTSAAFGTNNDVFFIFNGRGFPVSSNNVLTSGTIDIAGKNGMTRRIELISSGHTRIR